jgi:hypothetical protein
MSVNIKDVSILNYFISLDPFTLLKHIVACRPVTMQLPRDQQIHHSRYWVTRLANKTCSDGNDLSNISTAMNQHNTRGTVGNGVFYGGPLRGVISGMR